MERLLLLIGQAVAENGINNTWFISYAGHVDLISIQFYTGKWTVGRDPDYKFEIYVDGSFEEHSIEEGCKFIASHLFNIPS